jgi:thioesterase domain-containing protein/acyl carrier protein
VKIRGHRVELSEIERAILSMPEIADAAVTTYESEPGAVRLVAYVVPATQPPVPRKALRDFLIRQLPAHMIPWRFVAIEALPLSRTGKLDRDALPAPHGIPRSDETLQIGPRNAVEVHIKNIWEDLLALSEIGVREDFFELGGDSLLALDMLLQLERMFGETLPFDALWSEGATIEGLARILQSGKGARIWERAVPIQPHGTKPPLFVVHTTGGHLSDYLWFARYLSPDQPVYGLQARGLDGRSRPDISIESMAVHCLRKMREFQPDGPYRLAGYSSGGCIASEMARMIIETGGTVAPLILLDVEIPSFRVSHLGQLFTDACRLKNLRSVQERSYHLFLHTLGLDHLRVLRKPGESHRWAYWSYRPKPNPGQAVLFIAKNEDTERANRLVSKWRSLMRAGLEIEFIEGDHRSMMREPCVAELADQVQRKLDYFAGKAVT